MWDLNVTEFEFAYHKIVVQSIMINDNFIFPFRWPGQGQWLHDAAIAAGRVRDALGSATATGTSREHH